MSGTGAVRNIYISSSTSYTADCKNNLLVNTSLSGHPIYVSSSGTYTGDYNNLYGATNIGNYNYSNYTTLAAWISASNQDQHSLNINPSFININTGLQLTDYSLFIVPRLSNVLYDIDGKYRTAFTTIGAYSIPVIEGYNLELSKLVNPVKVNDVQCLGDYTPVKVIVKNSGTEDYYFNSHPMRLSVHVTALLITTPIRLSLVIFNQSKQRYFRHYYFNAHCSSGKLSNYGKCIFRFRHQLL